MERKKTKTILFIITFTILLYLGLQNIGVVAGAVQFLVRLLSPFIIGLCIAFIVNVLMRALEERVFTFMQRSKRKLVRKMRPALMPCAEYIDYTGYDRVSVDYDRAGNSAYGADHCKLYADLHFGSAELGKFHGGKVGPALGDCVGHQLVKGGLRRNILPAGTRRVYL